MPFDCQQRFLKKYNQPMYVKLNVAIISELSGIDREMLQKIYDTEYSISKTNKSAIVKVILSLTNK